MSQQANALVRAEAQVAAVRDDPAARLALMSQVFHGPTGRAPRHLPFRRAALSFMRWQARRGVLNPLDVSPPGSTWWRAVNERLLRDGCETVALLGGLAGEPSSETVRLWLEFGARPTGRNWYRAHNASIVGGYLEHQGLAEAESAPERFFMNVAMARVLYAHALVAAPRLALERLAPLGRLVGDPRIGMTGVFLSLRRVLPDRYPLDGAVERYIADEQRLGRMLDYAVIAPRLQRLYEWSAEELAELRLLELIRDGNPIYAWPFEERHVWRSRHMPFAGRALARLTRPSMADPQPALGSLQALSRLKTALLTTFRRDGTPVDTPVTIAVDGGRALFRTYDRAWKARRLRNNPGVEVAPATVSGKPRGEAIRGRTRLLEGDEASRARRLIARRSPFLQGVVVPLSHRLKRYRTLHYELVPSEPG